MLDEKIPGLILTGSSDGKKRGVARIPCVASLRGAEKRDALKPAALKGK